MRMILCLIPLSDELKKKIIDQASDFVIKEASPSDVTAQEIVDAEIILGWSNTISEALNHQIKLRWIQAWLAGVDSLPLKKLEKQGTYLTTASGANAIGIAEQVFGYLLIFARKLDVAVRNQVDHVWEVPNGLSEIQGKTMTVLGTGHIGQEIAKYANVFGMRTIGVSRTTKASSVFDKTYLQSELIDAVREADVVINCLPLTEKTQRMVNMSTFKAMKKTATYISVGRGKTTDNEALIQALQTKEIARAALDVYETEPLPKDNPLWNMDNVLMTPHSAGQTDRYNERIIDIFLENLAPYLKGDKPVRNLVNYDEAY